MKTFSQFMESDLPPDHPWHKTLANFKANKASKDPYWHTGQLVPTHELRKYVEYDRTKHEKYPGHFEKVKAHIAKHGIDDMGILNYNHKTHKVYAGEGNTRIAAAHALGIPAVPMRAVRWGHDKGHPAPKPHPDAVAGRHVGADIKPSEIGFSEHSDS